MDRAIALMPMLGQSGVSAEPISPSRSKTGPVLVQRYTRHGKPAEHLCL